MRGSNRGYGKKEGRTVRGISSKYLWSLYWQANAKLNSLDRQQGKITPNKQWEIAKSTPTSTWELGRHSEMLWVSQREEK